MQSVSSSIELVLPSISYDDNHYTTGTSFSFSCFFCKFLKPSIPSFLPSFIHSFIYSLSFSVIASFFSPFFPLYTSFLFSLLRFFILDVLTCLCLSFFISLFPRFVLFFSLFFLSFLTPTASLKRGKMPISTTSVLDMTLNHPVQTAGTVQYIVSTVW